MNCSIRIARCSRLGVLLLVLSLKVCSVQQAFGDDEKPIRVLIGRVADKAGNPIEGATVEWGLVWAKFEDRESVQTDADGRYRLETRNYDLHYRLGVWATGWGPAWENRVIPGRVNKPKSLNFTLRKPVSVSAQLRDPVTNAPIVDARILLWSITSYQFDPRRFSLSLPLPGPTRETRTDLDGWFHFTDLPSADADPYHRKHRPLNPARTYHYEFSVLGGAYMHGTVRPNDTEVHTKTLSNVAMFSGRVLDLNADPIDCFFVSDGWVATKFSSAAGKFYMQSYNSVALKFYANGYEPLEMPIPVSGDELATFECRMTPAVADSNRSAMLVDGAGIPIAGAQIVHVFEAGKASEFCTRWDHLDQTYSRWFTPSKASTTATGKFTYPSGCGLAILADGFARKFLPASVVPSADDSSPPKIKLEPECRLQGTITRRGLPCGRRELQLTPLDPNVIGPGVFYSDEQGHFEVASLQPGNYRLWSSISGGDQPEFQQEVVLYAGETKRVNLWGSGGSLELKGTAPPFSLLMVRKPNSRQTFAATKADVDGKYCFEGLPTGTYALDLWPPLPPDSGSDPPVKIVLEKNTLRDFKAPELDR